MKTLLRTYVSPVFLGGGLGSLGALEPLTIKPGHPVCWLDCLLDGGIQIPEGVTKHGERPLIWLVSGPHGSGKTTLAMELCYRLATQKQPEPEHDHENAEKPQPTGKRLHTILYSRESPSGRIRENMQSLGWNLDHAKGMKVIGSEHLMTRGEATETMFKEVVEGTDLQPTKDVEGVVAVFDGLGSYLSDEEIVKLVDQLLTLLSGKVWLVVIVLDLATRESPSQRLADRADILTQFNEGAKEDYRLRTLRVVKMRFQEHVQGDHVIKIYGKPMSNAERKDSRMPASDHIGLDRKEGGVFVLPSIHRHLSGGMRHAARIDTAIKAPVDGLPEILPLGTGTAKGFPQGRCTAFVGDRGGLKSYLAYYTLLNHLESHETSLGILLSLRDD